MSNRANVGSRLVSRSRRRRTGWDEGTGGITILNLTASGSSFVGSALAQIDGETLVRTRGYWEAWILSATSANDSFTGAFGIGIASDAAITAGIASVPTPITEQGWEGWLYWSAFHVSAVVATEAVGPTVGLWREVIDSKAMRKSESSMSHYAAIEVTEVGAASLNVVHDSRMLFKLP